MSLQHRVARLLLRLCLTICGLVASICSAQEQNIGTEAAPARFEVKRIYMAGAGGVDDADIEFETLNRLAAASLKRLGGSVSTDELYDIADALTLYVRGKGYMFHTVELPPQRIKDGNVRFIYREATLSDINIINRTKIKDAHFSRALSKHQGKALYAPQIEAEVEFLNRLPGVSVFAFYSRAERPDLIRLNLRVDSKSRHNFSVQIDNYGNNASGETRFIPSYRGDGLISRFDRLTLALLATAGEGGTAHGYLSYSVPFGDLRNYLRLSAGDTSYELGSGFSALEMDGSSRSVRAAFGRQLAHSKHYFSDLSLGLNQKQSRLDSKFDESLENREQSDYLELSWSNRFQTRHWLSDLRLAVANGTYSSVQIDRMRQQSQNPEATEYDLQKFSYGWHNQLQAMSSSQFGVSMVLNWRGQYADTRLPGIEQSSLGGVYGVRAIAAGRYSADTSSLLTAELALPFRISSWAIRPYVFWDAAQAQVHEPALASTSDISLAGAGAGLRLGWRDFSLNLAFAQPSLEEVELDGDVQEYDSESQFLFEARWH